MTYFKNIKDLSELKSAYRTLCFENHPDIHGDGKTAIMQEINAEFDILFAVFSRRPQNTNTAEQKETAQGFRNEFYTQSGWAGCNYDIGMSLSDIAPIVRAYVKKQYPDYKFSIRTSYFSGGCSLAVTLTQSPMPIYKEDCFYEWARQSVWRSEQMTDESKIAEYERYLREKVSFYTSDWDSEKYYENMNEDVRTDLEDVADFVNSYRMSDCDGSIDYFDTNFGVNFAIGKWDKPLIIKPRKIKGA